MSDRKNDTTTNHVANSSHIYSKSPWKTIAIYVILGFLWIYFSDHILEWMIDDRKLYQDIQTYKGTFYVLFTGMLLYFLIQADYSYILQLLNQVNEKNGKLQTAIEEVRRQKDFIQEIYKNCNTSIVLWDADGRVLEVNDFFSDTFGYSQDEACNMTIRDFIMLDKQAQAIETLLNKLYSGQNEKYFDSECKSKSGSLLNIIWTSTLVKSKATDQTLIVSFGIDVTTERLNEKKLHDFAYTDRLSGLNNRASFEIHLKVMTSQDHAFTLYYIDLDDFKHLNDIYGHHYGDHFLMHYANLLRNRFPGKSLFHWGGDEFILVDMSIDEARIAKVLDTITELTHDHWRFEHAEFDPSASIGYTSFPSDADSAESLLKNIDMALHEAKTTGKSKSVRYSPILQERIERNLNVEKAIKQALTTDGFMLHFQPVYAFNTKKIVFLEALIRWNVESFPLSVSELIEVAEERGLIVQIDRWVVDKAFAYASRIPDVIISINLSARSINSHGIIEFLKETASRYGVHPESIQFELTEHSLVDDMTFAETMVNNIRELGFKVALDDFGTRYSSLNYLSTIPFDTLKIDKSYIDNITTDQKKLIVVEEIVRLSKRMGLSTIAEGIETIEQHEILLELGCDYGQGYHYMKPAPFEQFLKE